MRGRSAVIIVPCALNYSSSKSIRFAESDRYKLHDRSCVAGNDNLCSPPIAVTLLYPPNCTNNLETRVARVRRAVLQISHLHLRLVTYELAARKAAER